MDLNKSIFCVGSEYTGIIGSQMETKPNHDSWPQGKGYIAVYQEFHVPSSEFIDLHTHTPLPPGPKWLTE